MQVIQIFYVFLNHGFFTARAGHFLSIAAIIRPPSNLHLPYSPRSVSGSPRDIHVLRKNGSTHVATDHEPLTCNKVPLLDPHLLILEFKFPTFFAQSAQHCVLPSSNNRNISLLGTPCIHRKLDPLNLLALVVKSRKPGKTCVLPR